MLRQMHMYDKKVIKSDPYLTITANLKNGLSRKTVFPLIHKIYHVANIKIEAI